MAQAPSPSPAQISEDAFLADRQQFWQGFCSFTTGSVIAVVVMLVLMAIFLV